MNTYLEFFCSKFLKIPHFFGVISISTILEVLKNLAKRTDFSRFTIEAVQIQNYFLNVPHGFETDIYVLRI